MSDEWNESFIGHNVKKWRQFLGLTQAELAERCQMSQQNVSMIESGKRSVILRPTKNRLQMALGITSSQLTDPPSPKKGDARTTDEITIHNTAVAVRQALDGPDDPPPVRSVDELSLDSDRAMRARMASDWSTLATILPPLVAATDREDDEVLTRLHIQACVTASLVFKPVIGWLDLGRLAAERAINRARWLGDPIEIGWARFALGQAVLAEGNRTSSLEIATRGANDLQSLIGRDEDAAACYGMSHLHAGLSAAALGYAEQARRHLEEATDTTRLVRGNPRRMDFMGPNCQAWGLAYLLETGDGPKAPEFARGIKDFARLSVQRQCRVWTDTARGAYLGEDYDLAVLLLQRALKKAPAEVITRGALQEMVRQMARDTMPHGTAALADLVQAMGIDPFTN